MNDDLKLLGFDSDRLLGNEKRVVAGHHFDGLGDLWGTDVGLWDPWSEHEDLSLWDELLEKPLCLIGADSGFGFFDPAIDKDQHNKGLLLSHGCMIESPENGVIDFWAIFELFIIEQLP